MEQRSSWQTLGVDSLMEAHFRVVVINKELNDYIAVFDDLKLVLQEEQLSNR